MPSWHRLPLLAALWLAACAESLPPDALPTPTEPPTATEKSLRRAHAHNDYEHERPLLDALEQGFASVEADVYTLPLLGLGGLYVAHDPQDIRLDRTLAALYLEPLKARAQANGGCIQPDCAPFSLLIDAKTSAESTWQAIEAELAKYGDLFTRYENGVVIPGAVTAILSGNRPKDAMLAAGSRYCFYDGRFDDLDSSEPASFMPLISDSWTTEFGWDGNGAMPADQQAKLRDSISRAHAAGRRVRLYNVPDEPGSARDNLWREFITADQDHINTDDLPGLRAFLLANDPLQR
ncbi:MAG: hypothetical protein EPN60_08915 [Nevskiaceae bacterium]|nr:MAG: hypothetical protein EPO48_02475 [Nevskiaceae bacterium]TAM27112.1 MAG: hypothetical protein EPN60_08915 [Nevskiaceae bacterium]